MVKSTRSNQVYFVGIKGVALAALAELMHDASWKISGSDVAEDFVTAPILQRLGVHVDGFDARIPGNTNLVVYTAAHNASAHPQVVMAKNMGIRCLSHAEALAEWSNQKSSIAVCGVGGKSSISAMIAWVLEKANHSPSFAIGVGGIKILDRAGRWHPTGTHCVVEADEYATDPTAVKAGADLIPRFHYLKPQVIVATAITYDHPDVYKNADHTWQTYCDWMSAQPKSTLLISHDSNRQELTKRLPDKPIFYYGQQEQSDVRLHDIQLRTGKSFARLSYHGQEFDLELQLPGKYNLENACAAFSACLTCNLEPQQILSALSSFASTVRRFEYKGTCRGAKLFDDYAHHPRELSAILEAVPAFVGDKKVVVAFQPHTFSRTKALWNDFIQVLSTVPNLILLDIFASARESSDNTIDINMLQNAILNANPQARLTTVASVASLAELVAPQLSADVVFLTIGAGNIYHVHDLLLKKGTHD